MRKNWWIIPAAILGYVFYKKYVLSQTFSVFFKSVDFSSISFLSPTLNLIVQVNNPTNITAEIQNIKGDLFIDNVNVGYVVGITPTTLETGSALLSIPVTLSYSGVAELIKKFNAGSGLHLVFTGSIMVDLITLPLNFEYNI
jgi:LEA14-like dessication related protein